MKKLFVLPLLIVICLKVHATDYYIAANGNDGNSGTSSASPWQSLNKLNASFNSLNSGDRVFLRRGDTFYGSIVPTKGFAGGNPVIFSAYGSGANPVITGFKSISSWNNLGGNIWESSGAVSNLNDINMVTINGTNTEMGRFPNAGWLKVDSHNGNKSITSSSLNSSATNWAGADLVIKVNNYTLQRNKITSASGSTLNYNAINYVEATNGYGFFLQDDARTLDVQNEWYFNPTSKKIRIYSAYSPVNVQISTLDTLVYIVNKSNFTFDGIDFTGSNRRAFNIGSTSNVTIKNCGFYFHGLHAIWGGNNYGTNALNFNFSNNTVRNVNSTVIVLAPEFVSPYIGYNKFTSCGIHYGMFKNPDSRFDWGAAFGVINVGHGVHGMVVEYNKIDSTGYTGISWALANNVRVNNNEVSNFCLLLMDGAGIYMYGGDANYGNKIYNNIVYNGFADNSGTPVEGSKTERLAHGIYLDGGLDGNTKNVEVYNNTCFNNQLIGIYGNGISNCKIYGNTCYNNGTNQMQFSSNDPIVSTTRNNSVTNNILVSRTSSQQLVQFDTRYASIDFFDVLDNNYYARPISDTKSFSVSLNNYTNWNNYTFAEWKAYSGYDANSKGSPKTVSDVNDIRFEYNATSSNKTVSLDANYIDVKNVSYNGSITLAPYTSVVLIRNGALSTNQTPTANAGADQSIILPIDFVTFSGTGTDPDGSISAFEWSQVSGPAAGITSPTAAVTAITKLSQGTYVFQLKVTDNRGAIATDQIQVTVGSAIPSSQPVAYAGADQTIYLPQNSSSLNGSGSVQGGTISVFNWTKISGPTEGVITNSSAASTTITGLVQGTYQFQLKVTDNKGATATSNTQISVGTQVNLLPAVNPGNTVNGIDYKYFEGNSYSTIPDFNSITPVKTGNSENFDIALANRDEVFAFNFSGYIDVPTDGQYTFYTSSDDGSNLYIDGVLVVNNDGQHSLQERSGKIGLRAGKHAISVGFFQQSVGKSLAVSYEGPNISKQVIPSSALYTISLDELLPSVNPANTINGIDYKYFEESSYSFLPDFKNQNPIKVGSSDNFDISIANRADVFAVSFNGYINVPSDGQYTFYTSSDDGSNLYIDGIQVVNNDGLHAIQENSGKIGLRAGKHVISVGFFQQAGGKTLTVSYEGPNIGKQVVPNAALYRVNDGGALLPAVYPANTVNGLDFNYYNDASSFNAVPNFASLNASKKGAVANFDISSATKSTAHAFNFTGFIEVPSDGQYTFYTTSDDGSLLFIDNVLVVNNDGLHTATEKSGTIGLKAGKHAISVGYLQMGGGSTLNVSYSNASAGVPKQLIPNFALYRISLNGYLPAVFPSNTVNGLDYKYYEDVSSSSVVPNFNLLNPLKTGAVSYFDISVASRSTVYALNFTGYIDVPVDGVYTFYSTSDDGSMLYIDNVPVINNDGLHSAKESFGSIGLMAGKHAISVGYLQMGGGAVLNVSYSSAGISKQLIPGAALYRVSSTNFINSETGIMSIKAPERNMIGESIPNFGIGVKAYPNPFVNFINVNINGKAGAYKMVLLDVSGRIIFTKNGTKGDGLFIESINTGSLPRGIYLLKITQNGESTTIKVKK